MPQTIGQGGTIRLDATFQDGTGTLVDPTTPRLDILNPSNIEVVTDAVPTKDAVGLYHYDYLVLAAAPLGTWRVHWTGVINLVPVSGDDYFEVVAAGEVGFEPTVGDPYITLEELRTLPHLGNTARFSDDDLIEARSWFETTFEDFTGRAFVPRQKEVMLHGTGGRLRLPDVDLRRILGVDLYSTPTQFTTLTTAQLSNVKISGTGPMISYPGGFPIGTDNIVMRYEYGADFPPADVLAGGKVAIGDRLINDASNRQYSVSTEAGVIRTSTPGPGRPFGIPFVDAIANRRRRLMVAAS